MNNIAERAHELAASGRFDSMAAICQQLKCDGYFDADIEASLSGKGTQHALMKLYGAALQSADCHELAPTAVRCRNFAC